MGVENLAEGGSVVVFASNVVALAVHPPVDKAYDIARPRKREKKIHVRRIPRLADAQV